MEPEPLEPKPEWGGLEPQQVVLEDNFIFALLKHIFSQVHKWKGVVTPTLERFNDPIILSLCVMTILLSG